MLPLKNKDRNTRSSLELNVVIPFVRSDSGKTSFQVFSTTEWNALPSEIKNIDNYGAFKKDLKRHYSDNISTCNSYLLLNVSCDDMNKKLQQKYFLK